MNEHVTPRLSMSNLDTCEEQESQTILSPIMGQSQSKTRNAIPLIEDEEEYGDENKLTQSSYDYETQDDENDQYEEIIIETTRDVSTMHSAGRNLNFVNHVIYKETK